MMPQSFKETESIDSKSKTKLESIERTARTRVEYEERAFRIVNKLIDGYVSGSYLVECGRLINRDHYNDIVEERAITQLCGYPVCSNNLGKTPNKKYHVSTKTNKVYEISERKNFCSNQCFKASRHFMSQIPDSPLWMRDKERLATIILLEHNSIKGMVGDEVIGSNPKQILRDEMVCLGELDKKTATKKHSAKPNTKTKEPKSSDCTSVGNQRKSITPIQTDSCTKNSQPLPVPAETDIAMERFLSVTENDSTNSLSLEDLNNPGTRLGKESVSHQGESDLPLLTHKFEQMTTNELGKSKSVIHENLPVSKESTNTLQDELSESLETETQARDNPSNKMDHLKALLSKRKNILLKMVDVQILEEPQPAKQVPSEPSITEQDNSTSSDKQNQGSSAFKLPNTSVNLLQENKTNNSNQTSMKVDSPGRLSPLQHVCNILRSWVSQQTVDYLATQSNNKSENSLQFSDPQVQQGYGALCHRLAVQEKQMEDLLGGDADTEKVSRPSKPVPDYKALREQTEAYTLNVMEFITGKKQAPRKAKDKTTSEDSGICLPTVDAYDQHQIRVRIVMDRLHKSLPEVLMPLGLSIQDVSSPIRELVQTCRLEKNNIVLRPGEWTLAALLILKMLSSRYPMIQSSFTSDLAIRHFSTVLARLGHDFFDLQANVQNILDTRKSDR